MSDSSVVELPAVTRLSRALGRLALVGLGVGVGAASLHFWSRLADFCATNQIRGSERNTLLGYVVGLTLGVPLLASCLAAYRSSTTPKTVALEMMARRISPVGALSLVPLLFHGTMWSSRPLAFYVTCALLSVLLVFALEDFPLSQAGQGAAWARALLPTGSSRLVRVLFWSVVVLLLLVAIVWRHHEIGQSLSGSLVRERDVLTRIQKSADLLEASSVALKGLGHACLELPAVVGLYQLAPQLETLLMLRVLLVALGVVPLFFWGRRLLGTGLALLLGLLYLMLPIVQRATFSEPLPLALSLPFYFGAAFFWDYRRTKTAIAFSLLTVVFNEQAAWWFLPLAAYLVRARGLRLQALLLAVSAMGYFLLVEQWFLPDLGSRRYLADYLGAWSKPEAGLWPSLLAPVTNPSFALSRWFETQTLGFWLAIWVPMGLLPLRSRRLFLWGVPCVVFAVLATSRTQGVSPSGQYLAHFIAMGLSIVLLGLSDLRRADPERGVVRCWSAMAGVLVAVIPAAYQFGCLMVPSP